MGKSPLFMGKSPFLMGKSPLFMGKITTLSVHPLGLKGVFSTPNRSTTRIVQVAKVLLDFGANPNDADSRWAADVGKKMVVNSGEKMGYSYNHRIFNLCKFECNPERTLYIYKYIYIYVCVYDYNIYVEMRTTKFGFVLFTSLDELCI